MPPQSVAELPPVKHQPHSPGLQPGCVVVLGAGDVGTAVAHALFQQGHAVLLVEQAQPTAPRRGMCWVDAVFDGAAEVAGVRAVRVFRPDEAAQAFACRAWIPLTVAPDLPLWLRLLDARALVDARLRKHSAVQDDLHALCGPETTTIGIGPGYTAGYNVDIVIESAWGDDLGRVIYQGAARELAGEPRPILGVGRERLVYAPQAGVFVSDRRIAEAVQAGDVIGHLLTPEGERVPLHAPLDGVLRGLTRPGLTVQRKTKLAEVDPRGNPALCFGLGERPMRIAQGVARALDPWPRAASADLPAARPHAA